MPINGFLIAASISSGFASLLHLGCIVFGASWYRMLGAGEQMASMAEQGHWYPTVTTVFISKVLLLFSLYAASGAGLIRKLPFLKLVLIFISGIYLLRAVGFAMLIPMFPENSMQFWFISSTISLVVGLFYLVGTVQIWPDLEHQKLKPQLRRRS